MTPAELVAWAQDMDAQGNTDAMGCKFSDWTLARREPDGRCMRDADGRQVFETQAEFLARQGAPATKPAAPVQMEIF